MTQNKEKLRMRLEALIKKYPRLEEVRQLVMRQPAVPQLGPYHQEGPEMDSHLALVLETLAKVREGEIDPRVPTPIARLMKEAVRAFGGLLEDYVLLHDLDKSTCLSFVYEDGEKQAVTWEEFCSRASGVIDPSKQSLSYGSDWPTKLKIQGVAQISYYQELEDGTRHHGRVASERLRKLGGFSEIIVEAIETHEVAMAFDARGGINIPLFVETFGVLSEIELGFCLVGNYADEMGAQKEGGETDINPFLLLAKSYLAWKNYQEVVRELSLHEYLNEHTLKRELDELRKSAEAFERESVEEVVKRLVARHKLPEYDQKKLEAELNGLIEAHKISQELATRIKAVLLSEGAIPREMGKEIGKANKEVREVVSQCTK